MWYRVFGLRAEPVSPVALAAFLHAAGYPVAPHFRGDDLGWTSGELHFTDGSTITLERYLTKEDDLRKDLNGFAAELELRDDQPAARDLMRIVIQTQQLIAIPSPTGHESAEKALTAVCQYLAAHTDGVYQIDGRGWFATDGSELLRDAE